MANHATTYNAVSAPTNSSDFDTTVVPVSAPTNLFVCAPPDSVSTPRSTSIAPAPTQPRPRTPEDLTFSPVTQVLSPNAEAGFSYHHFPKSHPSITHPRRVQMIRFRTRPLPYPIIRLLTELRRGSNTLSTRLRPQSWHIFTSE